jgi:hypothetical protein
VVAVVLGVLLGWQQILPLAHIPTAEDAPSLQANPLTQLFGGAQTLAVLAPFLQHTSVEFPQLPFARIFAPVQLFNATQAPEVETPVVG